MRYRTPTQLHASLYMQESFTEKAGSKPGKNAKGKTKRISKAAVAGTVKKKR